MGLQSKIHQKPWASKKELKNDTRQPFSGDKSDNREKKVFPVCNNFIFGSDKNKDKISNPSACILCASRTSPPLDTCFLQVTPAVTTVIAVYSHH